MADSLGVTFRDAPGFKAVNHKGEFVEVDLDFGVVAPEVFRLVEELGDEYGHVRKDDPELVLIDYSSPNVAKNMTVAHLRSTIIGQSLMKIHEAAGDVSFGINHIGDWGTQFGGIIYQYQQEKAENAEELEREIEVDPTAALMRIYRKFNAQKANNPEAADMARDIFLELEKGNPEYVELWKIFREWSLRDFAPTYERLGVSFDAVQGESFYEDRMEGVVEDALEKGVLERRHDDSIVFPSQPLYDGTNGKVNSSIMLDQDGEPRDEVIVKPSGGTVYLTRDLAAMEYRINTLGAGKILYVIGKEQRAHCMELFAMSEQMDYGDRGMARHVSFGHLNVDGRKMKSREGRVVLLNEVMNGAESSAAEILLARRKSAELTEDDKRRAHQLGVSALVFDDLQHDRRKDKEFSFDMKDVIEKGGSTYVQYTHARVSKILRENEPSESEDMIAVPADLPAHEREAIMLMAELPEVIAIAARDNMPHKVATYLVRLCKAANHIYETRNLSLAKEEDVSYSRALYQSLDQVIPNAARLVHLDLVDEM